jgi:hypothetical protein
VPDLIAETVVRAGLARTLTVCRSKRDCPPVAAARAARGLGAVVYPSRERFEETVVNDEVVSTGNCRNRKGVDAAEDLGLPPTAAVCLVCPYQDGCPYFKELKAAREAAHAVMTAARAVHTDLGAECGARDAVFVVNGRALEVLKPTVCADLDAGQACDDLGVIAEAADQCKHNQLFEGLRNPCSSRPSGGSPGGWRRGRNGARSAGSTWTRPTTSRRRGPRR